jgi:hypothetical protein
MYTRRDVTEGLALVAALSTSQWKLGDKAVMIGNDDLDGYADEIGLDGGGPQLRRYAKVAAAWPAQYRIGGVPWTLHRTLTEGDRAAGFPTPQARHARLLAYAEQCRAKLVKPSYRGLQRFLGERPTPEIAAGRRDEQVGQALTEMNTGQRAGVLSDLAADPETMVSALEHPEVRDAVFDAFRELNQREAMQRQLEEAQRGQQPEPAVQPALGAEAYLGEMGRVAGRLSAARRALNEAAEILNASPYVHGNADYREGVTAMTTGLRNRLDVIEGIASGQSFEAGLEALLAGDA